MEVFSFYVVDDEALPDNLGSLSDQEKFDVIVAAIESEGMLHASIEMSEDDFVDALEAIDERIEADRLLPICAMNNSPHNILGKDSDCPYLGFFDVGDVERVYNLLDTLDEQSVEAIESSEAHGEVFHVLLGATQAAVDAACSLAVIHS
jgi:hypothetical protein